MQILNGCRVCHLRQSRVLLDETCPVLNGYRETVPHTSQYLNTASFDN
jgi:hypothetical protein